ncbi:hypothetical protein E1B28_005392 [Marasmius oreades]|uniref:Uncharacterized protein n=1 Tax=Marasmius oreades TaxID=181124 RepID=A0A9P7UW44_9AGAR|nr:uncharacterized protein E1B28_005392 [Marasmius oreades]KAG7094564.1 hypothetical protein E1B28_005392 [Marasmius oreades]
MGGGARYPYPKSVWSPAGGWWTRPSNWKSNTTIFSLGATAILYGVFQLSSAKEHRYILPKKDGDSWTFSFSKQLRELKEKEKS